MVHRDVKGANFLVHTQQAVTRVVLIDFGVSRQYRSASGELRKPREKAQFR